jgi:hypothetical protein
MKARGAAIQGGLALVGLIAAYAAWQRDPEAGGAEDVIILEPAKAELERIRFDDGTRWTELAREREGRERALWMKSGQRPPPPPQVAATDGGTPATADGGIPATADGGTPGARDGGTAATPPPPQQPEVKPERLVRASEQAERLWERFTPLRATRGLGVLGGDKLKELGLEGSNRQLEVVARGKAYGFTVSPPGSAAYVRATEDGKVYLVSPSLISDLESAASRFVDRRLHTFLQKEVDTVVVAQGDKKRELAQKTNEQGVVVQVAAKSAPDKADEFAKNWLERIWRLIPVDILGKGEPPPGGSEPQVALKLEYLRDGKRQGVLELARVGKQDLYVRSEHTVNWVKVQSPADEILTEATKVVSGQ